MRLGIFALCCLCGECLCKAKKGLHESSVHQKAVYKVAKYGSQIYTCLGHGSLPELEKAGRNFVGQYMALGTEATSVGES